jgi:hypothetical protein
MNVEAIIADLKQQRSQLDHAITSLERLGDGNSSRVVRPRKRRTMSASARAKIAAAQRARWAKQKAGKK